MENIRIASPGIVKSLTCLALAFACSTASATEQWTQVGVDKFYLPTGLSRSQGITSDGRQWFFSWQYGLERTNDAYATSQLAGIPPSLLSQGLNHIGDIDYANGVIYAALDETSTYRNPTIALFNATDLSYTGQSYKLTMPQTKDIASWVAVDTAHGLGYGKEWASSANINVYNLSDWSFSHSIPLQQPLERIQGAKLRGDWLYLSSDNATKSVYRASLLDGSVEELFQLKQPTGTQEIEGLSFRDTPDGASLHVLLIHDPDNNKVNLASTTLNVGLYHYALAPVPEPAAWVSLTAGLALLATLASRLKRSRKP